MKITRRQLRRMLSEVMDADKNNPVALIRYLIMHSVQGNPEAARTHRELLRALGYDDNAIGNIVEMTIFSPTAGDAISNAISRLSK